MLYGLIGLYLRRCGLETVYVWNAAKLTMENFKMKKLCYTAFKNLLQIYISDHNCFQITLMNS